MRLCAAALPALLLLVNIGPAHAGWTVYLTSPAHSGVKQSISISYDVQQVHFGITDADPTRYFFYLNFVKPVSADIFADGLGSTSGINLDLNGDSKYDYSIQTDPKQSYVGNYIHTGKFFDLSSGSPAASSKCAVQTFTDLAKGVDWIGFSIPNDCLAFKKNLGVQGFSKHDPSGKKESDVVPDTPWSVNLDGSTNSSPASTTSNSTSQALTGDLPVLASATPARVDTPANPPNDLVALAANETKSVVTVNCGSGLGSGWSGKVSLTSKQSSAGYRSYLFTNYHVIKECTSSREVTVTLANQTTVSGYLLAWDQDNDVAGILTKTEIPSLIFSGEKPKEGWWAGVIGSPLGFPGVLTEGIISSVSPDRYLATTTAHINPGNSGGPTFDRLGRVVGLATAKYVDAEGFGIVHGTPMLCLKVVSCNALNKVWGTASSTGDSAVDTSSQSSNLQNASAQVLDGAKNLLSKILDQIKGAISTYPSYKSDLLSFQALAPSAPNISGAVNADVNSISEFATEVTNYGKLVNAKVSGLALLVKPQMRTITCVKAGVVKKVSATTPKCPTGYSVKI